MTWWRWWAFLALLGVGEGVSIWLVGRRNPELLRRRGRIGAGTPLWDKLVLGGFGVSYLAMLGTAALDTRYGWSHVPAWWWAPAAVCWAGGLAGLTWAMLANPHFEKTVRLQADRGHRVIDTGPYRLVRHPGYAATIVGFVCMVPILLGSFWAFVPGAVGVGLLVLRTAWEDRFLRAALPGYAEYAGRVRWRLLPGVW